MDRVEPIAGAELPRPPPVRTLPYGPKPARGGLEVKVPERLGEHDRHLKIAQPLAHAVPRADGEGGERV